MARHLIQIVVALLSAPALMAQGPEEQREKFGLQQFAPEGGFLLHPGQKLPPLIWNGSDAASDLPIRTRWFDETLQEVTQTTAPGRYFAYGEADGPTQTTLRRALTCVCVPEGFDPANFPKWAPPGGSETTPEEWRISEEGAVQLAALLEDDSGAGEPRIGQWMMENATRHVRLKRKLMGLEANPVAKVRAKPRPDKAPTLRAGSLADAGMTEAGVKAIEENLDAWFAEAGQPCAIVVSRNGVIALAKSYGELAGQAVTIDTPMLLHSAMKPLMGVQLAMYVDRGIVELDEPIGKHLPDFASPADRNLTFRAGHVHVSGIHFPWPLAFSRLFYFRTWQDSMIAHRRREWGPGENYRYGIVGIILAVRSLELMSGRNYWDAMEHEVFEPLGIRNILPGGTGFSAENLARIGVLMTNRGSYGEWELFTEETYQRIIPTQLEAYFPKVKRSYGIGLQSQGSRFGPGSFGHGGGCGTQLLVNPEQELVFAMVRNERGAGYNQHLKATLDAVRAAVRGNSQR